MARESTIKLEFELENPEGNDTIDLSGAGITAGTTTTLAIDSIDGAWSADPPTLVVGGAISLEGTGWASLDKKLHMITGVDTVAHTVTLATDSSDETDPLADAADIIAVVPAWIHACLTEFTPNVGAPGEIDATTMCDTERVNLPGLSSPGTATYSGPFDLDDPGMLAFRDAQLDAIPRYLMAKTRFGQAGFFHGVVSAFSMGALGVEALVPYTGSFTMDRPATYAKVPTP